MCDPLTIPPPAAKFALLCESVLLRARPPSHQAAAGVNFEWKYVSYIYVHGSHLRLCSCQRGFIVRARGIADVKAQARTVFVQQSGPRRFRAGRRIGQVDVTQTPRKPFGGGARGPRAS